MLFQECELLSTLSNNNNDNNNQPSVMKHENDEGSQLPCIHANASMLMNLVLLTLNTENTADKSQ